MQVEQELARFSFGCDSLVTIGVFDGVHLGHKQLIARTKELASEQGLCPLIVTFDKHPQEILTPGTTPPFLTDAAEKANLLEKEGAAAVIMLTFTRELSQLSAVQFINWLRTNLRMKGIVVGPDFALGHRGEGDIPTLRRLGEEMGFSVTIIPPVRQNGDIISSTAIRRAMAEGDMEKVQRFMSRPFSLHGKVVHGKGRGAGLGFPTVNLQILPGQAVPPDGVYATRAQVENLTFPSITNVGMNPTFGNTERTIESYLLDYHDNLYDREVKIDFIRRIRDEIKFDNTEDLVKQIYDDIRSTRIILKVEAVARNG
ncbi:MAG: bifunctional riboflavin kinase/FAD synthetase [Dehalococcoidales bacterium]|nr:bifunctional riboflavin kinase/FAD synthetase [Dehalococcoidales bacterium]